MLQAPPFWRGTSALICSRTQGRLTIWFIKCLNAFLAQVRPFWLFRPGRFARPDEGTLQITPAMFSRGNYDSRSLTMCTQTTVTNIRSVQSSSTIPNRTNRPVVSSRHFRVAAVRSVWCRCVRRWSVQTTGDHESQPGVGIDAGGLFFSHYPDQMVS